MSIAKYLMPASLVGALAICALLAGGQEKAAGPAPEQERQVKEAEVPPAALAALKKLCGGAPLTEFSEELEHGGRFYEGSWKTQAGSKVNALVTEAGDTVEIEEQVTADQVPAAVLAAGRKVAGADAQFYCEKKTMILYELKFRKDGKRNEMLYTPDGRAAHEEQEKGEGGKDDDHDD